MGFGCTLTVEDGAMPGAVEIYQSKIEGLAMRATIGGQGEGDGDNGNTLQEPVVAAV